MVHALLLLLFALAATACAALCVFKRLHHTLQVQLLLVLEVIAVFLNEAQPMICKLFALCELAACSSRSAGDALRVRSVQGLRVCVAPER